MLKRLGVASLVAISMSGIAGAEHPSQSTRLPATERGPIPAFTTLRVVHAQAIEPPEPLPPGTSPEVDRRGLTLTDLEQMALANNPSIARAEALVSAARGNWVQVGLPPNPTTGYEGQQIGSAGKAEQDGAFIGQEIVRGGKLRLNREIAAQEINRAEQQLAAQRQRVLTDVRIAYNAVLIANRQEQLTAELMQVAKEGMSAAETLFKGKEVGRADMLQAEIEYENTTVLIENARNRSAAAWQSLGNIIGQSRLEPQRLAGVPDEDRGVLQFEALKEHLLTASPEVAVAVANVERSRWALQRARVEPIPNVTVQGLVNWRDNGIGGASDGAITVGIPLPAWNRNQGGIAQAQAEVAAAERALQQVELNLQNRLAPVYERYANSRNQVAKYRSRIIPAASETLELTRRTYAAGEASYVSLLTAQRTYSQTNLNYLDALRELRSSEAELEGMLLRGSLEDR